MHLTTSSLLFSFQVGVNSAQFFHITDGVYFTCSPDNTIGYTLMNYYRTEIRDFLEHYVGKYFCPRLRFEAVD